MKKLLIIQCDEAYFLFETIQVLEKNQSALKNFEVTVLVDEKSKRAVFNETSSLIKNIISDPQIIKGQTFDVSVNLSLNENSWDWHKDVISPKKLGPYLKDGQTIVEDLWSTYLMTLKAKAPFLTFHLQTIYKNILGFKSHNPNSFKKRTIRQIAIGTCSSQLFAASEQEILIQELALSFPKIPLKDISELDLISDLTQTLYIGPANLAAIKFCAAGGKGVFLSSNFQGFNLVPFGEANLFVSANGSYFTAEKLLPLLESVVLDEPGLKSDYNLYQIEHENIFGPYLKCLNHSDDNYPFYQSHVVLWNYLLNLFDTNLEVSRCSPSQLELLKTNSEVITKLIRLHDYAMVSIDTIYHEAKAQKTDRDKVEGHLKNLTEIDTISNQISASHSMLRPVLDFYRIRRGQNTGNNLLEQSQHSFLTYSEEHQALMAMQELFSVTLKKNEVSI